MSVTIADLTRPYVNPNRCCKTAREGYTYHTPGCYYSDSPIMKLFDKEEAMSTKTEREHLAEEMAAEMEHILDKHKAFLDEERRHFHQMTGARDVLLKLWTLGAIHPDYEASIGAWMKEGGYSILTIDGITIVKGR